MKILLTIDCVGGVWTYGLELARQLTGGGHDVVVAATGAELTADQRDELDGAGLAAWAARPYRLEWMDDSDDDLARSDQWLMELADEHRPDVVHLNQFGHASLDFPAPTVVVAHSDVVTWWRAVHGCDPDEQWTGYRQRVGTGLAAADLVLAPTAAYLRELTAAYDFSTPTAVVHNGRSIQQQPRPGEPTIVAAGRVWDPAKNIAAAVRAAEELDWPLVVAGPGTDTAPAGAATFLGRIAPDELARLLAAAAVFVAPARYEPFGLAALEAGVAGCALVLGDLPTQHEVWGSAATFVGPDDEGGLRRQLQALIDDPQLLRARQAAARSRAAGFTAEAMAARYVEHYRRLLGSSREQVAS